MKAVLKDVAGPSVHSERLREGASCGAAGREEGSAKTLSGL